MKLTKEQKRKISEAIHEGITRLQKEIHRADKAYGVTDFKVAQVANSIYDKIIDKLEGLGGK